MTIRFALLTTITTLMLIIQADSGAPDAWPQQGRPQFVQRDGTHFTLNEKRLYLNGFNAYWMMYMAADPSTRDKVTSTFQQASKYGMNIARTWAFSDGGYRALQISPGRYSDDMFRGLDFVISEASKYGVYLILSLVNNWEAYGGKKQYVEWAKNSSHESIDQDYFYTNPIVRGYYKDHVKAVLTRRNTISGIVYKDDPTIFAWELMNEPRSPTDSTGKWVQVDFYLIKETNLNVHVRLSRNVKTPWRTIWVLIVQDWVSEMGAHVKSIDENHLLEVGLEGFYGNSVPERLPINPKWTPKGTDFISNNQVPQVDFATIHLYPDQWLGRDTTEEERAAFADKWVRAHTEDSGKYLNKPIIFDEFCKSSKNYTLAERKAYFEKLYGMIYASASSGGPMVGGLFWQVLAPGMTGFDDGCGVVLQESPSTAEIIQRQSRRMSSLS